MEMQAATVRAGSLSDASAPPQIPLAPMKRMQARFNPLADMPVYLVVFLGGFVGTAMRYGLNLTMPDTLAANGFLSAFHLPTFTANMAASFIFAALSSYLSQASWVRKRVRQLTSRGVGMGMCGGFSTLSAMMIEDLAAIRGGQIGGFLCYTLLSYVLGLVVAWVGAHLGLALASSRMRRSVRETLDHPGPSVAVSAAPSGDYGQPRGSASGQSGGRSGGQESAQWTPGSAHIQSYGQSHGPSHRQPDGQSEQSPGSPGQSGQSSTGSAGIPSPAASSSTGDMRRVEQSVPMLGETTLVPSFEPDPITDEIPMVEDPIRGEARER